MVQITVGDKKIFMVSTRNDSGRIEEMRKVLEFFGIAIDKFYLKEVIAVPANKKYTRAFWRCIGDREMYRKFVKYADEDLNYMVRVTEF